MTNEARFTLRLPAALKEKLDARRKEKGVSLNTLVIWILREWMEKSEEAGCKSHSKPRG